MKKYNLLPFEVIEAAASGDSEAMNRVVRHYSRYIARLCLRPFCGDGGNGHTVADEDMRRQLEAKLMAAVLKFRVA